MRRLALIVVALLVFAALAGVRANLAAAVSSRTYTNVSGPCFDNCIKHKVTFSYDGRNIIDAPTWTKSHEEHHIWSWDKWDTAKFRSEHGTKTAPNGTPNVEYYFKEIWGVHKSQVCQFVCVTYHVSHGSRLTIFGNGQIRKCTATEGFDWTWDCSVV